MDISNLKPAERKIEIVHPATKEQLGISVTLVSYEDERMKKVKRNIRDRRLFLDARNKSIKAEEQEEQRISLLYAAIIDWDWYGDDVSFRGSKPAFNRQNATEVFTELEWFMDQIDEAVGDEAAFFKASKPI